MRSVTLRFLLTSFVLCSGCIVLKDRSAPSRPFRVPEGREATFEILSDGGPPPRDIRSLLISRGFKDHAYSSRGLHVRVRLSGREAALSQANLSWVTVAGVVLFVLPNTAVKGEVIASVEVHYDGKLLRTFAERVEYQAYGWILFLPAMLFVDSDFRGGGARLRALELALSGIDAATLALPEKDGMNRLIVFPDGRRYYYCKPLPEPNAYTCHGGASVVAPDNATVTKMASVGEAKAPRK